MKIDMPQWLLDMPPGDERNHAQKVFLLKLAGLYATRDGRMAGLTRLCGFPKTCLLNVMERRERAIPPDVAVKIEEKIGRHVMPRELLRPDLFDFAL